MKRLSFRLLLKRRASIILNIFSEIKKQIFLYRSRRISKTQTLIFLEEKTETYQSFTL